MLSQQFVWITGHPLFEYLALARIWLEMVNACDLVSYDILESHCVSGKGGCTITKQSSSYLDHFQLFIMQKSGKSMVHVHNLT